MRHLIKRRIHAVDVVGDVALVAEDEVGLVVFEAAAFTDGAVEAAPTFLKYHFRHLVRKMPYDYIIILSGVKN